MPERRIVKVAIASEFLFEMLTEGYEIDLVRVTKGLPKGATFVGSTFDIQNMTTYLFFCHETLALVSDGAEIPYLDVHYTRYRDVESMTNVP